MDNLEIIALNDYLESFTTPERAEKINRIVKARTRHVTVAIENIYQSQNASALLRSAECLGIQDIHVIENDNTFDIHPDIALGSSKWLTIHRYNEKPQNTIDAINALKAKGYQVIATMPHEEECLIDDFNLTQPTAFLFGTELTGLSPEAIAHADGFVKIPMVGFTESFNISVSAALVMHNTISRLRKSEINWQLNPEEQHQLKLEWLKLTIKTPEMIINRFMEISKQKQLENS